EPQYALRTRDPIYVSPMRIADAASACRLLDQLRQPITRAADDATSAGRSILEAIQPHCAGRAPVDDITLLWLGRVVPAPTCCAAGPRDPQRIDPITGYLKLL